MRKWNLLSLGFSQIEVKGFKEELGNFSAGTSHWLWSDEFSIQWTLCWLLTSALYSVAGQKPSDGNPSIWPQTGGTMLHPGTRTGGNWLGRSMATVIVGVFMNSFVAEWGQSRATAVGGGIMAPGVFLLNPPKSDNLNKHYLLHNAKKGKLGEKC